MDLAKVAIAIAEDFRRGASGAANDTFAQWIGEVIALLDSGAGQADVPVLTALLQRGFEAQQRADYIALADVLQYELGPLLGEQGTS